MKNVPSVYRLLINTSYLSKITQPAEGTVFRKHTVRHAMSSFSSPCCLCPRPPPLDCTPETTPSFKHLLLYYIPFHNSLQFLSLKTVGNYETGCMTKTLFFAFYLGEKVIFVKSYQRETGLRQN